MSINHLSFNSTLTHITCCTDTGYTIYSISPLEKKLSIDMNGGVGIMKMFKKTNIVVLVGGGDSPFRSKETVVLWDQNKKEILVEIDMKEPIKNIIINENTIGVVLEKKVCLFNWVGTHVDTKETFCNEKGLCVTNNQEGVVDTIVTLGSKKGEIAVWKPNNDTYKTINAHTTNIESIGINKTGKMIATASEKGTLVRVFDTDLGELKYEFRRGSNSANIYNLCFSPDSTLLACCSGNGTVHVFDIYNDPKTSKNTTSLFSGLKNYLPHYFSSQWSFKQINLGNTCEKICCFDQEKNIHIATYDGKYYKIIGKNEDYDNIEEGDLYLETK